MTHSASIAPRRAAILALLGVCQPLLTCGAGLTLVAALSSPATAAEFAARNAAEVKTAMGQAKPGDVVMLESGPWRDQMIEFAGEGAPNKPIVLRARTPGGVKLDGSSRLEISGKYLQVEGLRFEGGALADGQAIVQFKGSRGEASYSRFTESAIVRYNPADPKTRYSWVALYGVENRVDHNRFEGQNHSGVTVVVFRKAKKVDGHKIDNNYFGDRAPGNGNGFETIRIGTSTSADSVSNTLVERNLFERTDGEVETVSVKSGGNVIRDNTFREVAGTITLRHGSGSRVESNIFLGGNKPGTGGIRVSGDDHIVRGNLLQDVEGRVGGAISLSCGPPQKSKGDVDYDPVKRLEVRGNVIAGGSAAAIKADAQCNAKRNVRPSDVVVAENVVVDAKAPPVEGNEGERWSFKDNEAEGGSPDVKMPPGMKRSATVASRGADGAARSAARPSAGPTKPALTAKDVGPTWWR